MSVYKLVYRHRSSPMIGLGAVSFLTLGLRTLISPPQPIRLHHAIVNPVNRNLCLNIDRVGHRSPIVRNNEGAGFDGLRSSSVVAGYTQNSLVRLLGESTYHPKSANLDDKSNMMVLTIKGRGYHGSLPNITVVAEGAWIGPWHLSICCKNIGIYCR